MARVVSALYVYPIKSLGGVSLDACDLEARGFADDRRWMLVDAHGQFMTQRTDARLALFRTQFVEDGLVVHAPNGDSIRIYRTPLGDLVEVTVWKSTLPAIEASPTVSEWFSSQLDADCRLVAFDPRARRTIPEPYGRDGEHVSFADGFPVTIVTEASLADLNARLDSPIPMNRFRPNLVVTGDDAFAEHDWTNVRIGETELRSAKTCGRCLVTTTDQDTGVRGDEPLRTLAKYRTDGGKAIFAHNYIPTRLGRVRVGDEVTVEK